MEPDKFLFLQVSECPPPPQYGCRMGRKLAALAACRACALAVVTGRDWEQLERNSSVCERPCEARVGELALRPGSDWMGV